MKGQTLDTITLTDVCHTQKRGTNDKLDTVIRTKDKQLKQYKTEVEVNHQQKEGTADIIDTVIRTKSKETNNNKEI